MGDLLRLPFVPRFGEVVQPVPPVEEFDHTQRIVLEVVVQLSIAVHEIRPLKALTDGRIPGHEDQLYQAPLGIVHRLDELAAVLDEVVVVPRDGGDAEGVVLGPLLFFKAVEQVGGPPDDSSDDYDRKLADLAGE